MTPQNDLILNVKSVQLLHSADIRSHVIRVSEKSVPAANLPRNSASPSCLSRAAARSLWGCSAILVTLPSALCLDRCALLPLALDVIVMPLLLSPLPTKSSIIERSMESVVLFLALGSPAFGRSCAVHGNVSRIRYVGTFRRK